MDNCWVLRWRKRKGREVPVIENASERDRRYLLSRPTRREVIESGLAGCRRRLEDAKKSVAMNEQYIADLERLLEKEPG